MKHAKTGWWLLVIIAATLFGLIYFVATSITERTFAAYNDIIRKDVKE